MPVAAVPVIAPEHSRRAGTLQLPSSIRDVIPSCAQSCLASFISNGYSSSICPNVSDLFCLCSHYENGSYTLGEGALSCIKLSCTAPTVADLNSAYDICNAQSNHVLPTHQTLLVTSVLSAELPATTSSSSTSPLTSSTDNPTTSMNSRPAPSGSEQTDSPSSPISTSSSPGPTEVTTAAATHGLTTAQIVGIVVAAIASLILIVGAIVLTSCCFRRRRLRSLETPNTTSSSDVSASNPWPFQKQIETAIPPPWELKDPRPGPGGVGISRRMQAAPEQAPPVPQVSRKETTEVAPELIGVAIGTTDDDENTPDSIQSTRTLSRLLPDPPSSIDQQYANQKRRTSIYSQGTVFEEDNPLANRKVGNPGAPVPLTPVYTRFPNQNPPVQIATEIGTSSERRPSLTLAIPPTAFKANTATIRPPRIVKMKQPSDSRAGQRETHYSQSQTRMNSLKQQHSQNEVKFLHPNYSAKPLAANSAGASRTRRPDIQKVGTRGSLYSVSSRRPRDSTCSETSFESGDDDPTPPEETAKKLSPVKESPISAIRYPKIPRSSNQMIPRRSPNSPRTDSENTGSPKQRSWRNDVSRLDDGTDSSSSISTLLAKRRGDAAAQDIERRLGLPPIYATASQDRLSNAQSPKTASSSNTLGSNVQSWQVVGGNRANFANALKHRAAGASGLREPTWIEDAAMSPTALRSPMWEPRLTPTRRGDDLMLSVT